MIDLKTDENWLEDVLIDLQYVGFSVIKNCIEPALIEEAHKRIYLVKEKIIREVGENKLARAGELGVLRLIMKYDPFFVSFIELPEILAIIDSTVSETAILHLQNGFINPPIANNINHIFQYRFHRDFPRILSGFLASINIFIAITEFTAKNGATLVVPGSHQKNLFPNDAYIEKNAIPLECPAGSIIIFDSTLLHAAGKNITSIDRIGINQQFTRSYIKQQIDYVRAVDNAWVQRQKDRTQQFLGYYTRVVTSLDEYYLPEEERLYRRNQG